MTRQDKTRQDKTRQDRRRKARTTKNRSKQCDISSKIDFLLSGDPYNNKLGQNCLRFSGHFLINLIIILSFYIFHIDSRCNPRCENEAMCTSSGRCACRHGYTGQACQTGNIIILRLV